MTAAVVPRLVTGALTDFSSTSLTTDALGLALERMNLNDSGLPSRVIETIQSARA